MKYLSPKLRNLLFISMLFYNCSADRFLKEGQTILLDNKLIINGEEKKRDFANQLIFPKKQKQLFISKINYQVMIGRIKTQKITLIN